MGINPPTPEQVEKAKEDHGIKLADQITSYQKRAEAHLEDKLETPEYEVGKVLEDEAPQTPIKNESGQVNERASVHDANKAEPATGPEPDSEPNGGTPDPESSTPSFNLTDKE